MLVEADELRVAFKTPSGSAEAVRGVSFQMDREKLGIVGESGSGKSLTVRSLLRLLPPGAVMTARSLRFDGVDLLAADEGKMEEIRGRRVALVMQDPKYSLNPMMAAGAQIAEAWRLHRREGRKVAWQAALDLLAQVQISDVQRVARAYPHQLSGGMGQRVMIAMALAADPELLIADEPTSALDATVQAEILSLLEDLVARRAMALLLISHDLPLVSAFCDRVMVMYAGRVMETLPADDLLRAQHPYTRGLVNCLPLLGRRQARLPTLPRDPAWLQ